MIFSILSTRGIPSSNRSLNWLSVTSADSTLFSNSYLNLFSCCAFWGTDASFYIKVLSNCLASLILVFILAKSPIAGWGVTYILGSLLAGIVLVDSILPSLFLIGTMETYSGSKFYSSSKSTALRFLFLAIFLSNSILCSFRFLS